METAKEIPGRAFVVNYQAMEIGVLLQYPLGHRGSALDSLEAARGSIVPGVPYFKISISSCGSTYEIKTRADFPQEDVPCSCGNPTHWFVKHIISEDKVE